ncbi:hypothetical protein [Thermogutta sp.]|jgi:hypothetical protein|uniref:hypothetical protein n=1 Tax=Thermogutta sp. TaxID=1962930 RepID=UPI003C7BF1B6
MLSTGVKRGNKDRNDYNPKAMSEKLTQVCCFDQPFWEEIGAGTLRGGEINSKTERCESEKKYTDFHGCEGRGTGGFGTMYKQRLIHSFLRCNL